MPSSFHYSLVVLVSVIIAVASELLAYTLYSPSLPRGARFRRVAPRATVTEMPPPPPPPRSRFGTTAAPASGGVGIDGVCRSCNTTENPEVRAYYVALKKLRRKSVARVAVAAPSGEFSVCLVTQCSEERHAMFGQLLERWGGPASAAVWVTTDDGEASVRKSAAAFLAGAPPPLQLQILRGRPTDPYPVNRLRNLAVAAVTASHFFVCDVDLWPSEGLHAALRALPPSFTTQSKHAMVVPAFEVYSSAYLPLGDAGVPRTLDELKLCALQRWGNSSLCDVFKHSTATHTSTWYRRWWKTAADDGPYKVPCFDSIRYEPYVLVPRGGETPAFDEEFVGYAALSCPPARALPPRAPRHAARRRYGKNKIQFIQHLRLKGFTFWVLPNEYVIHVPHTESLSRRKWSEGSHGKKNRLFINFMAKVMDGATIRVPLCLQAFVEMSQDEYA